MPTAIEIFKLLPKTNCGECGFPTCLAFAMQLANQKVKLDECPYVSDNAKASLEASAAPPIRLIKIGTGDGTVEIGDETELFRHEKKFFHPVAYALSVSDSLSEDDVKAKVEKANALQFERVGQMMIMDMVAIRNDSGDAAKFASAVEIASSATEKPLILLSNDAGAMSDAASKVASRKPLLHCATHENAEDMAAVAKELTCPLVVKSENGLDGLADLVVTVKGCGVEDMVLDFSPKSLKDLLEKNTIIRKHSVKKTFRGLGYPTMVDTSGSDKALAMGLIATMKYGSIVVFDELAPEHALPLYVLRQNIFTDPQVPIQVKPDIYPINNPGEDAPLMFTTNFSLTYFTVMGDIEKSKVPVWLQVVDTEGLSVMTAFAAGKLTPETVAKALSDSDAYQKSKNGKIIIPGMVTRMSGKLEELTDLKVVVGPRESSGIPKLLKSL
ncbi:MAG: acetyl-CoA decarbonylase/synthase complex subunit gamma [Methanomassiliicoccales archaeon]|nr:acetyl-CoA decarbonylase/synthase complex subunit gamma [Methanomassiliicoccales archaeon]NYT15015.1 acetyl-CoA decarbonylase/synthase complex subunit gamma [Methanomassiliicoccales archaeon]